MASRSGIHINPKNKGKFTASAKKAGQSVQAHARSVLANPNATPLQKKRANFARNAAKWHHEYGGDLLMPSFEGGGQVRAGVTKDGKLVAKVGDDYSKAGTPLTQMVTIPSGQSSYRTTLAANAAANQLNRLRWANFHGAMVNYPTGETVPKFRYTPNMLAEMKKRGLTRDYIESYQPDNYQTEISPSDIKMYAKGGGLSRSKDYGSSKKPYPMVKSSDFAGGGRSYPIPTKADAIDALRLAGLHGRADVRAKVYARYPELRKKAMGGSLTQSKAKEILRHGSVHGHPLTEKQQGYFGLIAGGGHPYAYGGLLLDQYGFGSWLKENAAGLIGGAGSLLSAIPVVGNIAGPVLGGIGKVLGASKQKKLAQEQADAQQAYLDQQAAAQERQQMLANRATRMNNLVDKNQIYYGATFGTGGSLGAGLFLQPQITDYSVGNTHQQGIGGIPVDAKGNPSKVSNQSAVGLTEKGEVTWNGYVFSNRLKNKR